MQCLPLCSLLFQLLCAAVNELYFRPVHVTPLIILRRQGLKLPLRSIDFVIDWQSGTKLTNLHTASPTLTLQLKLNLVKLGGRTDFNSVISLSPQGLYTVSSCADLHQSPIMLR